MAIIIQKNDDKSQMWQLSFKRFNIDLIPQPGSPIKAPFFLLLKICSKYKIQAYIVRYLNDYPSLLKTLLRTGSEVILIYLCKILHIKIFWICHNVDSESACFYNIISQFRRHLISKESSKIYVTDKLITKITSEIFKEYKNKIDYISFGERNEQENISKKAELEAKKFLRLKNYEAEHKGYKFMSLLMLGAPSKKCLHYDYLIPFIEKAKEYQYLITAIVSGFFENNFRENALKNNLIRNDNIYFFNEYTSFSFDFIREYIDFYLRSYSDISIPYTIYEAVTVQKPILALKNNFFSKLICTYNIGVTVDEKLNNVEGALKKIENFEKNGYENFLNSHKWNILPEKIIKEL